MGETVGRDDLENEGSGTDVGAVLEDGVLAGLVGAGIVAAWFLLIDSVRNAPFYTPTLLGSVIFAGKSPDQVTEADPTMIFSYSGLHGMAFLLAGLLIAWMFQVFEQNPQFGMVLLLLFLLFESIVLGLEMTILNDLVGAIGTWAVAVANFLSATGMFAYLLRRRPLAFARLRAGWAE